MFENEAEMLGLQIRPVGGDEFEAVSFLGGLPGQARHQPKPMRMIGRRSDDFVILSGGPWAIIVENDSCLLLDRKGKIAWEGAPYYRKQFADACQQEIEAVLKR